MNPINVLLSNVINLSSDISRLVESIDHHGIYDVKSVIRKIDNVRGRLRQTISSVNNVRKYNRQLGRQDLNKVVDNLSDYLSEFKVSIINLLYCIETSTESKNTIKSVIDDSKRFMTNLDNVLDRLAFPTDIKEKIVHYQNNEVKSQLEDVPHRDLFRDVFNEAYHHSHHHSHNSGVKTPGPQFDKRGDWYHDGVLTHWDGEKFEDLYLRPNGRKLSCGFLVQDENTGKYLGCHPTGQPNGVYDIPKGCKNVGADDLETAIRELKEETGLEISENGAQIEDLGIHNQKKDKDIHLFKVRLPINIEELHCDSMFRDFRDGSKKPEMDGFELLDDSSKFLFSIQPIVKIGM